MIYPYGGKVTYEMVKALYRSNGYLFYETGQYNVNIFGFRNKDLTVVDKFNDLIGVAYLDEFLSPQCLVFAGTTKPGLVYLKDKLGNPNGTAILIEGFYAKCWEIGIHNAGKPSAHEAYRQIGPGVFKVYRDNDKDGSFDMSGPVYTDASGVNGHTTRDFEIMKVGGFSAACQVVQDDKEHQIWLAIGKRSAELYGNKFSYALFREK